jgi:hypothetical protein
LLSLFSDGEELMPCSTAAAASSAAAAEAQPQRGGEQQQSIEISLQDLGQQQQQQQQPHCDDASVQLHSAIQDDVKRSLTFLQTYAARHSTLSFCNSLYRHFGQFEAAGGCSHL